MLSLSNEDHPCDRQTDRQTNIQADRENYDSYTALAHNVTHSK